MEPPLSITGGSQRATCWSLTINNPSDADTKVSLPSGWKIEGQYEEGDEGTKHFQGMLTTPQVRFSAVKKLFPRAHIEVARNKTALKSYVHKDDTRVGEFTARASDIPTIWDYQRTVAARFDDKEWQDYCDMHLDSLGPDDCMLGYIDSLVRIDILAGMRGVEFIAINPMWRSSWKRFAMSIVKRERALIQAQNESTVQHNNAENGTQVNEGAQVDEGSSNESS